MHTKAHTHARAHGKRCIIIVMSGPSLPASSTTKCLEYWRRGWQQCGKIESYSLAAIPLRCGRGGRGEVAPLAAAATATAAFSFPSLLLRASFTVSGLKTSSP